MLGCPIVNFRPLAGESYDYFLPNVFGSQCKTQEESIDAIQAILEQPASARSSKSNEDIPERAHQIFANFKKDAMGLVLGVLGEAEQVARGRSSGTHAARLKLGEARFIAVEESKHLVRRAFFRTRYLTAQHNRQRFGGFDRAAIEKKLAKLRDITGNSLELQVHSRNIIELSSTRAGD